MSRFGHGRRIHIVAPGDVEHRGVVKGRLSLPLEEGEKVNLFLFARDGNWYLQREISFWQNNWFFVNCYFGVEDSPAGTIYIVRALVGHDLEDPAASSDIFSLTHDEFKRYLKRTSLFNTSHKAMTERK